MLLWLCAVCIMVAVVVLSTTDSGSPWLARPRLFDSCMRRPVLPRQYVYRSPIIDSVLVRLFFFVDSFRVSLVANGVVYD